MEAIKFSVELNVNVNLTAETKNFISNLFAATQRNYSGSISQKIEQLPEPKKEVEAQTKPEPKKEVEAQTKPEPKKASVQEVGIEDVRSLLATKINEHRPEIKAKLTELGAPSVTKLDPEHYIEMYNFLQSL